ncbi:hypothetical protein [Nannocystis radixulma]|uniref:Dickkopf N-terminal cysteine-rich domain-containing protein n=1 Tax=Nannocystis radixulma TaxID=2995305 RepID=A0ABT5BCI2_9BACT|nr:hypothetical protein [Nannocystis radixulma]MDC0671850.1 hypothetical protein [Nannocystis radixulma]
MRTLIVCISCLLGACGPDSPAGTDSGSGTSGGTGSDTSASETADVPTSGGTTDGSSSGGGTSEAPTGAPPLECPGDIPEISTPEALAETIAAITCAKAEACGCPAIPADCVAQEIEGNLEYYQALSDSGQTFDPACAGVFAFNEEVVACDRDTPSPCPHCPWFDGSLQEGAACTVGQFGVDGCAGTLTCVLGRCTQLVEVGPGEPCEEGAGDTIALCSGGHFCRASTDVCTPYPALGEACVDGRCESGSRCESGTCVAQLPEGSGCTIDAECLSFRCLDGACAPNSLACRLVAN